MKNITIIIFAMLMTSNIAYGMQANCSSISISGFNSAVKNIANYYCNVNTIKNIEIINNINNFTVNHSIKNGYFFVVDNLNSLIGVPKRMFDYIYESCENKNLYQPTCNDCFANDKLTLDIYRSDLSAETGISKLAYYSDRCMQELIPPENDYTASYVFLGFIGLPLGIFVVVAIGTGTVYGIKFIYKGSKKAYCYSKNVIIKKFNEITQKNKNIKLQATPV